MKIRRLLPALAAIAAVIAACSDTDDVMPSQIAPAATTVDVVTESDVSPTLTAGTRWYRFERNAGDGTFVTGPATPPLGSGSFQMNTPADNDKVYLFNYEHRGTPLASINEMSYSTFRQEASTARDIQLPAINIEIDFNGSEADGFSTLVFEPYYTYGGPPAIQEGAWQSWDAYKGGDAIWWSSRAINGVCAFSCFVKWSDIIAANPNATVLGGYGLNQGGGNPGLLANVDALVLGVGADRVTYDFELTEPPAPPVCQGKAATIYVVDGVVVGGPEAGQPYDGSLDGTGGSDVMVGTERNETINGLAGSDTICGLAGKDTIYGGTESDSVNGDGGEDTIYGGDGNDTLRGGNDNDRVYGDADADQLYGDDGDDVVTGDAGNDTLYGGAGDDNLGGRTGGDTMYGDAGNDSFSGNEGNDVMYGGADNDTMRGGNDDDRVYGDAGVDTLYGDGGNDVIAGDDGDDMIYGGTGNDNLGGRLGNDVIYGESGNDSLTGNEGDDTLYGGNGADTMRGVQGADRFDGDDPDGGQYDAPGDSNGDGDTDTITDFTSQDTKTDVP